MRLKPIVDLVLSELDAVHRTNIRGTFVVDRLAARRLRAGGAIVNFSTSVVGLQFPATAPTSPARAPSKPSPWSWPRELRGRDITVNAVAPGTTATPLSIGGTVLTAAMINGDAPAETGGQ